MMSMIYHMATKVHVWLGPRRSFAGRALELIKENRLKRRGHNPRLHVKP
jgi:hypothetical protein